MEPNFDLTAWCCLNGSKNDFFKLYFWETLEYVPCFQYTLITEYPVYPAFFFQRRFSDIFFKRFWQLIQEIKCLKQKTNCLNSAFLNICQIKAFEACISNSSASLKYKVFWILKTTWNSKSLHNSQLVDFFGQRDY